METRGRHVLAALGWLLAACGPADQPAPRNAPAPAPEGRQARPAPPSVRLLDRPAVVPVLKVEDLPLSRVEVTWRGRADTVPAVLVRFAPVVLDDSTLTGLDWTGPTIARGFRFRAGEREVTSIALPEDLPRGGPVVRLSPDGRHIAYVGEARCGAGHCARVTVRRWPTLARIAAHQLPVRWGDRLDPRDRIDWLDTWRVAFELYDGQLGERTVAEVRLAAGGLRLQRQPIPAGNPPD